MGERILEIRTYRLRRGTTDVFARRVEAVMPMLGSAGIEVVGHGPSAVNEEGDHYVLIRAFTSLAERDRQEKAFYGSAAWREGPRDAIMACIEAYHTVVLPSSDAAIAALTESLRPPPR